MNRDRLADFEAAVTPHVESLYRIATALTDDPQRAENAVVATLRDAARSFDGKPPDRGLLLGSVYRRISNDQAPAVAGLPFEMLPRSYRDVVLLASLPDVRLADVAVALGIPVDTARTRRRRALALMYRRGDESSSRA